MDKICVVVNFKTYTQFRHIGAIVGYLILRPLLTSSWPLGAFVFPEALIVVTLIVGLFFQPETKGKVWSKNYVSMKFLVIL